MVVVRLECCPAGAALHYLYGFVSLKGQFIWVLGEKIMDPSSLHRINVARESNQEVFLKNGDYHVFTGGKKQV